jgi:hypothetical protein
MKAKVTELLSNDGADATGGWIETPPWRESGRGMVVAALDGDTTFASSVTIEGSHDGVHAVAIGSALALDESGATESVGIDYPWPFLRAVAASGSGTPTALKVTLAQ